MIILHKKRTDKRTVICGKFSDNVSKYIVIDEGDPIRKDSKKYARYFEKRNKNKQYVLCDGCWDTYSHIHTI